jgi:predicted acetyltransferase
MELVTPTLDHLPGLVAALEQGWSPSNERREEAIRDELAQIAKDPAEYVALQTDIEAKGPPIRLPDGSAVPRIPGYRRWLWDGEFCGIIGLRWMNGTHDLPPTCLGHIGYSIVPWKQRRGYGTAALAMILRDVPNRGLEYVELTTDPDNIGSQKVIVANGGVLVERFLKAAQYGGKPGLRYRIDVTSLPGRRDDA